MGHSGIILKYCLVFFSAFLIYPLSISPITLANFSYLYRLFLVAAFYALVLLAVFRRGDLERTLGNVKRTLALSLAIFVFTGMPLFYGYVYSIIPYQADLFSLVSLNVLFSIFIVSLFYLFRIFGPQFAKIALLGVTITVLVVNCLYVGILYMTGFEFGPVMIMHTSMESLRLALKEEMSVIFVFVLVVLLLTVVLYALGASKLRFKTGMFTASFCLLAFSSNALIVGDVDAFTARKIVPAYALYDTISVYKSDDLKDFTGFYSSLEFLDSEKDLLSQHGIPIDWHPMMPTPPSRKYNTIIVYLESFQRDFTKQGGWKGKALVPAVDDFVERFTAFSNYYNSMTPTINAIITSQCGVDIQYSQNPVLKSDAESSSAEDASHIEAFDYFKGRFYCLPDILRHAGYTQVFMKGADMDFSNTRHFFQDHGYDALLGRDELFDEENYKQSLNAWGLQDVDLFNEALARLDELEKKQPFNLTLLTVNSHSPGFSDSRCPIFENDNELLNGIHCTDYALGIFLDALFKRKLVDNTYVILVGDHTLFDSHVNKMKGGDRFSHTWYGKTFFSVYSPKNDLPKNIDTIGYSPDFAATVLDLLGFQDVQFIDGKSILGMRKSYQHLVAPAYEIKDGTMNPKGKPERWNACSLEAIKNTTITSKAGAYDECERAKIYAAQMKLLYMGVL
jgi:hypothetical protein